MDWGKHLHGNLLGKKLNLGTRLESLCGYLLFVSHGFLSGRFVEDPKENLKLPGKISCTVNLRMREKNRFPSKLHSGIDGKAIGGRLISLNGCLVHTLPSPQTVQTFWLPTDMRLKAFYPFPLCLVPFRYFSLSKVSKSE